MLEIQRQTGWYLWRCGQCRTDHPKNISAKATRWLDAGDGIQAACVPCGKLKYGHVMQVTPRD